MAARTRSPGERREAAAARRSRRAEIEDAGVVMEAAATFLSVRSRSVEETRRRLRHLGYPPALCDEVVDRLITMAYLDDRLFATAWVESRDRSRPRGAMALRRELQLKGIADAIIRDVLDERAANGQSAHGAGEDVSHPSGADAAAAARLLERRAASLNREPDPRRRRQRAYALLARNGFAPDICHAVAASVMGDADADADGGV